MKEHPILFNAEMVRAVLAGRKTQTRRVIRDVPSDARLATVLAGGIAVFDLGNGYGVLEKRCPYGKPGDRLWVRETHFCVTGSPGPIACTYRADVDDPNEYKGLWNPSIYMPRWASRITLEVKAVRVERVQDITGEDAKAEGVTAWPRSYWIVDESDNPVACLSGPVAGFAQLWNQINKKRGYGWDANPWVWVVEFERIET